MRRTALVVLAIMASVASLLLVLERPSGEQDRVLALGRCAELDPGDTRRQCLSAVITSALDDTDFRGLAEELGRLSDTVAGFRGDCHVSTHALGDIALGNYRDLSELIVDTSPRVCGDGMAHAIMETYAIQGAKDVDDWVDIVSACADYLEGAPGRGDGCAHGFGHGTVIAAASEGGVPAALRLCRSVLESVRATRPVVNGERSSVVDVGCSYGVMMGTYAPAGPTMQPLADPVAMLGDCQVLLSTQSGEPETYVGCMAGAGFVLGADLSVNERPADVAAARAIDICIGAADYSSSRAAISCSDQVFQAAGELLLERSTDPLDTKLSRYHRFCAGLAARYGEDLRTACLVQPRNTVTDRTLTALHAHDPSLSAALEQATVDFGS